MNTKLQIILFSIALTLIVFFSSCTTEEERWTDVKEESITEVVTNLDAKRIISFKVTNPGESQVIHSAVNTLDKTITIYLPSYYEYEYLEVAIALPEKTTITPAASELIPVFSKTPFTYTTKATDGTTAIYTVKIVIQQPEIILNELSTATATKTYAITAPVTVTGANFLPSYEITKLFVVDAQGNKIAEFKYYGEGLNIWNFSIMYNFSVIKIEDTPLKANTDYWLRMESYSLSKTMEFPVRFQ